MADKKYIYNLEFPPYCNELNVFGYKFSRISGYKERLLQLQHIFPMSVEFEIPFCNGGVAVTAEVEIPTSEENAVFWFGNGDSIAKPRATALDDIIFLLSLFTGRDLMVVEQPEKTLFVNLDPRQYKYGGILISLLYQQYRGTLINKNTYGKILEDGVNTIYERLRTQEWLEKYQSGYFLLLFQSVCKSPDPLVDFSLCWTLWEHLFSILNSKWLSSERIEKFDAKDKISFLFLEYTLREEVTEEDRQRIKNLVSQRNRIVHFGKSTDNQINIILFINLTEYIIAKILGLHPTNLFNTIEKIEKSIYQNMVK